ncbi:hypothetical protein [Qipengyuania sphaerica]|uniref:hypothetical protein n=1 Tax=Qipengyuania sphaerica TaxID=2867243 RepID=UPI001C87EAE7|nr:hypothetical protein [Qipengyuania sphaerica]MBX7541173.1 hypothetical protein [Qipengyuania sphaerica]
MKITYLILTGALLLGACGEAADETADEGPRDRDTAWTPPEGLPNFADRQDPNPGGSSWMNRLEPQESDACTFTDKPVSDRPNEYVLTAWSGNLDLYTPRDTLEHRRGEGFIESAFMRSRPVVAARDGMDDLWIEPVGEDVVLYIGADELTCRRDEEEA